VCTTDSFGTFATTIRITCFLINQVIAEKVTANGESYAIRRACKPIASTLFTQTTTHIVIKKIRQKNLLLFDGKNEPTCARNAQAKQKY
jgi:hypothetical protein